MPETPGDVKDFVDQTQETDEQQRKTRTRPNPLSEEGLRDQISTWPTGDTRPEQNGYPPISTETTIKLTDPGAQKGIAWRMEKIQGIIEAREQGRDDKWITTLLLRSGITPSRIQELLRTATLASVHSHTGKQQSVTREV